MEAQDDARGNALIVPLGDSALLVRFGTVLSESVNRRTLALAAHLQSDPVPGVIEIVPSLVSVLVRYDPFESTLERVSGEIGLRLSDGHTSSMGRIHDIPIHFGGADGPDLETVAAALNLTPDEFIVRHNAAPLRVLATGFAPGFVYCGFHAADLVLPRRTSVRPIVPAGTILFAAGQTAIAATDIPTGWHVIGRTDFRNFDATLMPPTQLAAGDSLRFEAV